MLPGVAWSCRELPERIKPLPRDDAEAGEVELDGVGQKAVAGEARLIGCPRNAGRCKKLCFGLGLGEKKETKYKRKTTKIETSAILDQFAF